MLRNHLNRNSIAIMLAIAFLAVRPAMAASTVWTGASDGFWYTQSNWEGDAIPGPPDDAFFDDSAVSKTVVISAVTQVASINLDSSDAYTFIRIGFGSLTMHDLSVLSGPTVTHQFVVPITPTAGSDWSIGQNTTVNLQEPLNGGNDLTKSGAGTLVLSGDNGNYTGDISISVGELEVGVGDSLSANTSVDVQAGATLRIVEGEGFGGLSGQGTVINEGGMGVGNHNAHATFDGTISGAGDLAKQGTARLVLTGANTYTGPTEVRSGTLRLNNTTGSATGTGPVEVQDGGKLSGNGISSGHTTVLSGGVIAAGQGVGTLTLGDVTFEPGSTLEIQLGGPTPDSEHDVLAITDSAQLGGALDLRYSGGFTAGESDSFVILTAATLSGDFDSILLPQGQNWVIDYDYANGQVIAAFDCDNNGEEPPHRNAVFPNKTVVDNVYQYVRSVFAADLDGDGDTDILGAAWFDDELAWWENTAGDGSTWTKYVVIENYNGVSSVFAADVDGDGDNDILGAATGPNDITWWENTAGNGTTWTERTIDGGFGGAISVFSADVDGDGDTDVLGAARGANEIAWWENLAGNGTAWIKHAVDQDFGNARSVFAADVDGDGDTDVLGAAEGDDEITWWENTDGDGTVWTEHIVDGDFTTAYSVHAADLDGDGDTDILGAARDEHDIVWWENMSGDGTAWTKHSLTFFFLGSTAVYSADLDGDGDNDILGAANTSSEISWWENTSGNGTAWTEHSVTDNFLHASCVIAADVNGDGAIDIVGSKDAGQIGWWQNRGGQYGLVTSATAPGSWTAGQTDDLFEIVVTHNGRPGDNDIELESLALLFEESAGVPMTTQQAEGVVDSLSIYLDDGSGDFSAAVDALVATVDTLDLTAGLQTIVTTPGDPLAVISHGAPNTYFVVISLQEQVSPSSPEMFDITHVAATSTVVDSVNGCSLLQENPKDKTKSIEIIEDCNGNGLEDAEDIDSGTSSDCDSNAIPDECDPDTDGDGIPDDCDVCPGSDDALDGDGDSIPDGCDACPGSDDTLDDDGDSIPDGCDACPGSDDTLDDDGDSVPDGCDACPGFDDTLDEDGNGIPDACDVVPCVTHGDCADLDGDGIRDDGCLFWACEAGTCVETEILFADMGGQFGECPVDGTADGNDRFHALNCFANTNPNGDGAYPCETNAPQAFNVDAGGQFGSCSPDGVCDGNDAFAALNAFAGTTSCSCPLDGAPAPLAPTQPVIADVVVVELIPSVDRAATGDIVEVDVYITGSVSDLRGYQLHTTSSRDLELIDIVVENRHDHAFAHEASWEAYNLETKQVLVGIDTEGIASKGDLYLVTLVYKVHGGDGTALVDLLHDDTDPTQRTFLFATEQSARIEITAVEPALITVNSDGLGHSER